LKHFVQALNANVQHPEHRTAVPSKPARAAGRSILFTLQQLMNKLLKNLCAGFAFGAVCANDATHAG
jgi:hypothetical protein